jgi:hypothetical protein
MLPKSGRYYVVSIVFTVGSIAFAIMGDREAFRERHSRLWEDVLTENAKKVAAEESSP